jgi:hypothetical protein
MLKAIVIRFFASVLFFLVTGILPAQKITQPVTDTLAPGYYMPLDSNTVFFSITITSNGSTRGLRENGNQLPPSTVYELTHLSPGAEVIFSYSIIEKGVIYPMPTIRYIVGIKNTNAKAIKLQRSEN